MADLYNHDLSTPDELMQRFDRPPITDIGPATLANADPDAIAELESDLDLLTADERADYEERKRRGELRP
jgi:hypothetical protein